MTEPVPCSFLPCNCRLDGGVWCTGDAVAFTRSFGFAPDCEYGGDSDPAVPNMTGPSLRFGNNGGQALLLGRAGQLIDALVYENGDPAQAGWQGEAVEPYVAHQRILGRGPDSLP